MIYTSSNHISTITGFRLMTCTNCLWGPYPDWHKMTSYWLSSTVLLSPSKCTIRFFQGPLWFNLYIYLCNKTFFCFFCLYSLSKNIMGIMKMKQGNWYCCCGTGCCKHKIKWCITLGVTVVLERAWWTFDVEEELGAWILKSVSKKQ